MMKEYKLIFWGIYTAVLMILLPHVPSYQKVMFGWNFQAPMQYGITATNQLLQGIYPKISNNYSSIISFKSVVHFGGRLVVTLNTNEIVEIYLEKIRDYKDEVTIAGHKDQNDNIFLALYQVDNLTNHLFNAAGGTTDIQRYSQEIHANKTKLKQVLLANYSSPCHFESYTQLLISNSTRYYYDP